MKRLAILIFSILCLAIQGKAQSFTQHIQQRQNGKGVVTVTQSKEIENLVNGNNSKSVQQNVIPNKVQQDVTPKKTQQDVSTSTKKSQKDTGKYTGQPKQQQQDATSADRQRAIEKAQQERAKEEEAKKAAERAAAEKAAAEKAAAEKAAAEKAAAKAAAEKAAAKAAEEKKRAEAQKESEEEMNIPTVDMRKKVMRNARKVTGYRVQAFAGGNTRADKNRAQQIGKAIKLRYPDQPIYVHFYSPRWICRVGNYRSYGEASRMLHAVKAMGYRGATIVKGKITVFE